MYISLPLKYPVTILFVKCTRTKLLIFALLCIQSLTTLAQLSFHHVNAPSSHPHPTSLSSFRHGRPASVELLRLLVEHWVVSMQLVKNYALCSWSICTDRRPYGPSLASDCFPFMLFTPPKYTCGASFNISAPCQIRSVAYQPTTMNFTHSLPSTFWCNHHHSHIP